MKFELVFFRKTNEFSTEVEFKCEQANQLVKVCFVDKTLDKVLFSSRNKQLNFFFTYWWCPKTKGWLYWGDITPGTLGGNPTSWREDYWKIVSEAENLLNNRPKVEFDL